MAIELSGVFGQLWREYKLADPDTDVTEHVEFVDGVAVRIRFADGHEVATTEDAITHMRQLLADVVGDR